MNFREFVEKTDITQIERIYDKAHIAVQIVNMYNPRILDEISTIADLASGAYGLYNSSENNKVLPPQYNQKLIYLGKGNDLTKIPYKILQKYFPGIDKKQITFRDTIHVNIRRIMSQFKDPLEAILQIAATIVHEATHEREKEETGTTSETNPQIEEKKFITWAIKNREMIKNKFPEIMAQHGKPVYQV